MISQAKTCLGLIKNISDEQAGLYDFKDSTYT
jgi:hypothetical protein